MGAGVVRAELREDDDFFLDPHSEEFRSRNYDGLGEGDKQNMAFDEVAALYLSIVAPQVNEEYYAQVLRFMLHYRECLNKYGYEKKAENLDPSATSNESTTVLSQPPESVLKRASEMKREGGFEFASVNNAEHAPEVCNEFVTVYLAEKKPLGITK